MSSREFFRHQDDFNRRMEATRRARERQFRIFFVVLAVLLVAATAFAIVAIYLVVTTSPEQAGAFLGRIASGFRSAG